MIDRIFLLIDKAEEAIEAGEIDKAQVYAQLVESLTGLANVRGPMAREVMQRPGRPADPGQPVNPGRPDPIGPRPNRQVRTTEMGPGKIVSEMVEVQEEVDDERPNASTDS